MIHTHKSIERTGFSVTEKGDAAEEIELLKHPVYSNRKFHCVN